MNDLANDLLHNPWFEFLKRYINLYSAQHIINGIIHDIEDTGTQHDASEFCAFSVDYFFYAFV